MNQTTGVRDLKRIVIYSAALLILPIVLGFVLSKVASLDAEQAASSYEALAKTAGYLPIFAVFLVFGYRTQDRTWPQAAILFGFWVVMYAILFTVVIGGLDLAEGVLDGAVMVGIRVLLVATIAAIGVGCGLLLKSKIRG